MPAADGRVVRDAKGAIDSVKATLNYVADSVPVVRTRRDVQGTDEVLEGVVWASTRTLVHNARGRGHTLGVHGFELRRTPMADLGIDFYTQDSIVERYRLARERLVRDVTGANFVRAFDHNVRSEAGCAAQQQLAGGGAVQAPAPIVHGDFTAGSAPRRVRQLAGAPRRNYIRRIEEPLLTAADAERSSSGVDGEGFALVNVWRPISTVCERPLALCDASTIRSEELVSLEVHYADRVGENYFSRPSRAHAWHYFREMSPGEVILLKAWDSLDARGGGVPAPFVLTAPSPTRRAHPTRRRASRSRCAACACSRMHDASLKDSRIAGSFSVTSRRARARLRAPSFATIQR